MGSKSTNILIYAPGERIFKFIRQQLVYESLELIYIASLEEIEGYVSRARPRVIVMHIDNDPDLYETTLEIIHALHRQEDPWLICMADEGVALDRLRSELPVGRTFLARYEPESQEVLHNLLSVLEADRHNRHQLESRQFEESFNHCLRIIYNEAALPRIFARLVNYLPKIIDMDYWVLFTGNEEMRDVGHYAQFVPPIVRDKDHQKINLRAFAFQLLGRGKSFSHRREDDPEMFDQLSAAGCTVEQLQFIPMFLNERAIGGVICASSGQTTLAHREIRMLNELALSISRRMMSDFSAEHGSTDIRNFADTVISNRFDEDTIFNQTCRKLNEVARGSSVAFWQYNKGFGFIFPKFCYFNDPRLAAVPHEKDMIFFNKDAFLSSLIDQGKVQAIDRIDTDKRVSAASQKIFKKMGYCNCLLLPLKIHGEIIGALIINKSGLDERFTIWDIHQAEEIVKRTRKIIEDARTVKEANLKLKQLSRIFELGNELKLDITLEDSLSRITSSLRKALGWNDVAVLVLDDLGQHLQLISCVGFEKRAALTLSLNDRIPAAQVLALLEKSERIGAAHFVSSHPATRNSNGHSTDHIATEWRTNDLMIIGLETRNKVLGYMLVHDPVDRLRPTPEKSTPLEYYANQAAIAIENHVLYEELRASQERYRSLADTMSLSLVTHDADGRIVYANPAFQDLLGLPEDHLLFQNLRDYFSEESREKLQAISGELLAAESDENTQIDNIELEVIDSDQQPIPVSVLGFPFYERRKKTGVFLIFTDLRVIKRLERMKADFNSMIVHDLRSPMNVIQGFIELIRNHVVGEVNTEQEELLDIAKENVRKVLSLVDNFLVASKLDVGKFSIDPRLDEINSLIERQVENHKMLVKNKQIRIHLDLDRNLPLLIFDNMRIDQVMNNLLSNAMKFTPEKGDIYVQTTVVKKEDADGEERLWACVSVKDTGIGIPENSLPHIFDKYEQVDANQNYNVRGTGLGLSICRDIIKLHNGDIWAESEWNKGSTFAFTLPIEPEIEKIVK